MFELDFPSFSEGLSLRLLHSVVFAQSTHYFPSFSEGLSLRRGTLRARQDHRNDDFPSFSEGLSLRHDTDGDKRGHEGISLPFRRDFH